MSNSNLVTVTNKSPNKNSPRNKPIDRITIHCFVGQVTAARGCEVFLPVGKKASCNYVVGKDGDVGLSVDEADRSWCSSSAANDNRAITIEVASDTKAPYAITDAAYKTLLALCEDICRRNGKAKLLWLGDKDKTLAYTPAADEMVMTVHRWFANKACPGDYIYERLPHIAQTVTAALGSGAPIAPAGEFKPFLVRVRVTGLRIRAGAGTNCAIVRDIRPGVYTIVETKTGAGASLWGRLKSGVGWISLDFTERV